MQTCVVNNSYVSKFFNPSRGIRQWCPISANISVLFAEILSNTIRQNRRINGIIIYGHELKISQYADDTCLSYQMKPLYKLPLLFLKYSPNAPRHVLTWAKVNLFEAALHPTTDIIP